MFVANKNHYLNNKRQSWSFKEIYFDKIGTNSIQKMYKCIDVADNNIYRFIFENT